METTFKILCSVMKMDDEMKGKFGPESRVIIDSAWEARIVSTFGPERTLACIDINPTIRARLGW
jgi:hypothetical protein